MGCSIGEIYLKFELVLAMYIICNEGTDSHKTGSYDDNNNIFIRT